MACRKTYPLGDGSASVASGANLLVTRPWTARRLLETARIENRRAGSPRVVAKGSLTVQMRSDATGREPSSGNVARHGTSLPGADAGGSSPLAPAATRRQAPLGDRPRPSKANEVACPDRPWFSGATSCAWPGTGRSNRRRMWCWRCCGRNPARSRSGLRPRTASGPPRRGRRQTSR